MPDRQQTPMEQIESLFDVLIDHYGEGDDREIRVAAKMLIVALDRFRQHGGPTWADLASEYTRIAVHDREKFDRIVRANRSEKIERSADRARF